MPATTISAFTLWSLAIRTPSVSTAFSAVPTCMVTPASTWRACTTFAISSGTPRIRMRGCASTSVTSRPSLRALEATSRPMKPPPMIAADLLWRSRLRR